MPSSIRSAGRQLSRYALLVILLLAAQTARAADFWAYAGTSTNRSDSKGIYVYRFQPGSGRLTPRGLAAATSNPTFLAADKTHQHVYAVNEDAEGAVSAFAIDPASGKLRLLGRVSSRGNGPCHLALDGTGRWLAVANYGSGSFTVLAVKEDGSLGESAAFEQHAGSGPNRARQQGPHAHCVLFSADNRYLLVADLGLDRVMVYRFNAATGAVALNDPPFGSVPPGAGARHLLFHPNGRYLYTIDEMASAVTSFRWDAARGALEPLQTVSTLPPDFHGASTAAELAIGIGGTRLYASNRGSDTIALFAIDPERFTLTPMENAPALVKTPRHFTLDPTGKYLLAEGQDSDNIAIFKLNPHTGQMVPAPRLTIHLSKPMCLVFVPRR
ncbi:MAG: lactonase family protein [Bryobacteraceae bacterium]